MVQKYKYMIVLWVLVTISIVASLAACGKEGADAEQEARIPGLEEGVNVHELENEIFEVLGPENVAITTDRSSGSGILWQYDGKKFVVITTSHLMQDFESGEVELWTGEKVPFSAQDVQKSSEIDLAVIEISYKENLKMNKAGAGTHAVQSTPEVGTNLWIIDSVYGAASGIGTCFVAASEIFLEDYDTEMLLLYGEGKNGMSGCPIYDEQGGLVAMLSGMSEDGTTLAAVPVAKIMKFLETLE